MTKFLSSLLVSAVLLTNLPTTFAASSELDQALHFLAEKKAITSQYDFRPDEPITRAAFLKLVFATAEVKPDYAVVQQANFRYSDVSDNAWYAPYVYESVRLDAIDPIEPDRFGPELTLTRFAALQTFFKLNGVVVPRQAPTSFGFSDVKSDSYLAPVIYTAVSANIIDPQSTNLFGAFSTLTRGEAALLTYRYETILDQGLDRYSQQPTTTQPATSTPPITIQMGGGNNQNDLAKLKEVMQLINTNYLHPEEVDKNALLDQAIKGLVDEIGDPYTTYFTAEENQTFSDSLNDSVTGIGAYVEEGEGGGVLIVTPLKGSPAQTAGLEAGDIIIEVNDQDITDLDLNSAISLIRGPAGSEVNLKVRKADSQIEVFYTLTRQQVNIASVEFEQVNRNIAVITINKFSLNTAQEFATIVDTINQGNYKGIVLDLRNNPGGFLEVAVQIAEYFVSMDDPITSTIDKNGNGELYISSKDGDLRKLPVVTIVNKGSASAAEILAAVMQDYEKGKVIGVQSFGKGTAQFIHNFSDGSALKITFSEWLSPLNRHLNKAGVTPDLEIINQEDGIKDEQMDRALFEIKRMILNSPR